MASLSYIALAVLCGLSFCTAVAIREELNANCALNIDDSLLNKTNSDIYANYAYNFVISCSNSAGSMYIPWVAGTPVLDLTAAAKDAVAKMQARLGSSNRKLAPLLGIYGDMNVNCSTVPTSRFTLTADLVAGLKPEYYIDGKIGVFIMSASLVVPYAGVPSTVNLQVYERTCRDTPLPTCVQPAAAGSGWSTIRPMAGG